MQPIPVGVVGVGHMGWLHARLLAGLDEAKLAAVHDPDPARASRAATEFNTEAAPSLDELAGCCRAVVVASPTTTHHDVVEACLARGLDVLVEKPLAETREEGAALVASARAKGRVLAVGHTERFNPVVAALKGRIENPVFVEAHRLAPFVPRSIDVDVILDLMIHDVDLVLAFHPEPIERVDASGVPVVTGREDIANARVAFADGAVANLTASRVSRERMRRVRFFAGHAYFSLDLLARRGEVVRLAADPREWLARGELPPVSSLLSTDVIEAPADANPLRDELADFVAAVRDGQPPEIDADAGLRALDLALQIRERVFEALARIPKSPDVSRPRTILMVAGEASGDLHAARLVNALREREPDIRIVGVGGENMRKAGVTILHDNEELGVVGITEVWRRLPHILGVLRSLRRRLRDGEIDLFIPVDFPDFNFRLARAAHTAGVPIFYFIAPQVWAWRRGRIRDMTRWCGGLGVLFPFEKEFFSRAGIPVVYAGHPLVEELRPTRDPASVRRGLEIGPDEQLVALLPGSRRSEVDRHQRVMVDAVHRLRDSGLPVRGAIGRAPTIPREAFQSAGLPVVDPPAFDLAHAADVVLTASGTATVEVAIADTPMVVIYRLSPLTWSLASRMVRVPHVAMVNLVAGERLVPELLQQDATADGIARETRLLLEDPERRQRVRTGFARVRHGLAGGEGVGAVADHALALIADREDG